MYVCQICGAQQSEDQAFHIIDGEVVVRCRNCGSPEVYCVDDEDDDD